ncbi:MAG: hypothetical protein AAF078_11010, partial [Planctomycetota bacterium]
MFASILIVVAGAASQASARVQTVFLSAEYIGTRTAPAAAANFDNGPEFNVFYVYLNSTTSQDVRSLEGFSITGDLIN